MVSSIEVKNLIPVEMSSQILIDHGNHANIVISMTELLCVRFSAFILLQLAG